MGPLRIKAYSNPMAALPQGVLDSMVIDTTSDHNTNDTARRVAKMYLLEVFKGRYVKQPTITEFPNAERLKLAAAIIEQRSGSSSDSAHS